MSELSQDELDASNELFENVRRHLEDLTDGDDRLLFAYRRRLFVKLIYWERGTPARRKALKRRKMVEQKGVCAFDECLRGPLPQTGAELDRIDPFGGYTDENTRLVHHDCHVDQQRRQGYRRSKVKALA